MQEGSTLVRANVGRRRSLALSVRTLALHTRATVESPLSIEDASQRPRQPTVRRCEKAWGAFGYAGRALRVCWDGARRFSRMSIEQRAHAIVIVTIGHPNPNPKF